MKKFLKRAVSFALAVLIALSFASCSGKNNGNADREPVSQSQQSYKKIGSGSRSFYLDIEFENGSKSYYEVSTDGTPSPHGVDKVKIQDGEHYSFSVES